MVKYDTGLTRDEDEMHTSGQDCTAKLILLFVVMAISSAVSQDWIRVPGIDSTEVLSIIRHDGVFYAASPGQIFKSADGGESWQPTPAQAPASGDFYTLFSHGGYLYLGTFGQDGAFRSADGGQSWENIRTGLSGNAASIVGFAALGDSLYAGTNGSGVYVLNLQNPVSWSAFNTGLFQFGVNSITTSGTNIVAGIGLYLFVRARAGTQWSEVYLDSIATQRLVYEMLVLDQYLYAGTDRGVYKGTLDAKNWQKVDITALPNRDIVAFASHESRLMAGVSFAGQYWIFSTDDGGATWDIRAHEFAELYDLLVAENRLWAGRSDGLWYSILDVSTGTESSVSRFPSRFQLYQNYPNPFNPATTISYTIPKSGPVQLEIYDIRGMKVRTLVSEFRSAGSHSIDFHAGNLASGLYIYKLQTGEYSAVKKLLLVR